MPDNLKKPDKPDIIDDLSRKMDNLRVAEYVEIMNNPKKLIWMNFIIGLVRGLGMGIGITVLAGLAAALLVYILRAWVNLPYIGKLIADLIKIIEAYR